MLEQQLSLNFHVYSVLCFLQLFLCPFSRQENDQNPKLIKMSINIMESNEKLEALFVYQAV